MAGATLEQVTRLAEQLTPEEKRRLVEHLTGQLRPVAEPQSESKKPVSLRGLWRGRFPEDVDVDVVLSEIRHEWEQELDEVGEG